jgi:hypothetical protein
MSSIIGAAPDFSKGPICAALPCHEVTRINQAAPVDSAGWQEAADKSIVNHVAMNADDTRGNANRKQRNLPLKVNYHVFLS